MLYDADPLPNDWWNAVWEDMIISWRVNTGEMALDSQCAAAASDRPHCLRQPERPAAAGETVGGPMSLVQPARRSTAIDFSPGFLDTPDPVTLPPGATPDARNAFLYRLEMAGTGNRRATMGMRPGHTLLTPDRAPAAGTGKGCTSSGPSWRRASCSPRLRPAWFWFDGTSAWVAFTGATGYGSQGAPAGSPC